LEAVETRVCHKCGFTDPPIWKHQSHKRFTDYTHRDELKLWEPDLYARLCSNKLINTVTVGAYRYHLSKAGYVHRIALIDLANPSNPSSMEEPDMERPKNRYHPETVKLMEFQEVKN
jgi:hypothetical protein